MLVYNDTSSWSVGGVGKPAHPSSLRDEDSRGGSHRVGRVTPRRLTSSSSPCFAIPRNKTQACISVKSQPIRVHGQWDQTPSQTFFPPSPLPSPTTPFLPQPRVSACCLSVCLSACVRACARATSPSANFTASHPRS